MIGLKNDELKDIVNMLVYEDSDLITLYREVINNVNGDGVENSIAKAKWDSRYNSLVKVAKKHKLRFGKIQRGNLWQAIFIVGEDNAIYIFFSHQNLKNILRKGKSNHYLRLLNFFNKHFKNHKPLVEQLEMKLGSESSSSLSDAALEEEARKIVSMLEEEPSKVVVFSFNNVAVSTVKAYVFNDIHQAIWQNDYTYLLERNYTFSLQADNSNNEQQEKPAPISSKKQIVKIKKISN